MVLCKMGQINKSPNVESRDKSKERLPNPNGLKISRIIADAPKELRGSGFLKIKFPITIITYVSEALKTDGVNPQTAVSAKIAKSIRISAVPRLILRKLKILLKS